MTGGTPYTASNSDFAELAQSLARLTLDELGSRIVTLAGRLAAATCRWLLLVAAFDQRDGASAAGLASTAHWLGHSCGLAHRTAVEHVRVARALAAHPALASEMAAGRLSYSHVRAISRVVRDGERTLVGDLIEVARYGTVAQLESMVRGLRTIDDNETEAAADRGEYATSTWSDDSRWQLTARLDPERGALVESAIERVARAEQISFADALVRMAEIALASGNDHELRGDERAAVVVHLDASRLSERAGDEAAPNPERSAERAPHRPAARIANGPGLPDRVVQRLLCAGRVRTMLHSGNPNHANVLDVGRSHRLVTERQFRALLARHHGHCAYPGCPSTKRLQAHHIKHWLHGGRTDLDNLILLCERHHLAHHDGEFTITALRGNRFRFVRRDGHNLGRRPDARATLEPEDWLAAEHPHVTADAATTQHDGQRLDRDYALAVLAARRYRPPLHTPESA